MSYSPINNVRMAMPEVNTMSFITTPDSSSWFGKAVQTIKDNPLLFRTALVVGIIGLVGYIIYKAETSNKSSGRGDNLTVQPSKSQSDKKVSNNSQDTKINNNYNYKVDTSGFSDSLLSLLRPENPQDIYSRAINELKDNQKKLDNLIDISPEVLQNEQDKLNDSKNRLESVQILFI